VIIVDAIREWRALTRWTPGFFRDRFASKEVRPEGGTEPPQTMAKYIDQVLESSVGRPAPYLRNVNIRSDFPELVADVQPNLRYAEPDRLDSRWLPRSWLRPDRLIELFIAGAGARFFALHYDIFFLNNFISQIYGEKEFFLFPPDQTPYLYPKPDRPKHSAIEDPEHPDLRRFPLFAKAKMIRLVLRPGETLFVAPGWWHTTRMLTPSISVGTSNADRSNWSRFVADVCQERGPHRPKTKLIEAYLKLAGTAMAVTEHISGRW